MKSPLTQLFLISFIFSAIISCDSGVHSNETTENSTHESKADPIEHTDDTKSKKEGPFHIKSGVIVYEDKNLKGDVKAIFKLSFDDYGSLVKLEETTDGKTSIYMFNDATQKGVTLFPGRKPSKIFMRQGEINRFVALRSTSGFTQQDQETILEKECDVYANNAKSAEGESQLTYWLHEGIVFKEINRLGTGYMFQATAFEQRAIEKTAFTLPEGLELPHDIF